jgi:DNA-binding CsgD family transcriptional regulator
VDSQALYRLERVLVHLENIYRLLQVSSRTAAVTRAFADRTA